MNPSIRLRRWVQGLSLGLTALALLAGSLALAGSVAWQSDSEELNFAGVQQIQLESESEELVFRTGGDQVRISRTFSWSMSKPRLKVRQEGQVLNLLSTCPVPLGRGCSGKISVTVPAGVSVTADSAAGDVRAYGLTGQVQLSSSAGSVLASELGGGQVRVNSSAGDVRLGFSQPPIGVNVHCSAGDVVLSLPEARDGYQVSAKSTAGLATVTGPINEESKRRIYAKSTAGDVIIRTASPK